MKIINTYVILKIIHENILNQYIIICINLYNYPCFIKNFKVFEGFTMNYYFNKRFI